MKIDSIKGNLVIITGGATSIGFATAQLFLQYEAKAAIAGRNPEAEEQALPKLKLVSQYIDFVRTDITKYDSVRKLFEKAEDIFGKIDIVFNNAGLEGAFSRDDLADEKDLNNRVAKNIKGTWLAIRQAITQFKKQGTPGLIVNTSPRLAQGAMTGLGIYSATKAALHGLTRAVAIETAPFNIRVNNVNPRYIVTPKFRRFI